jgi:hypothetical protein
MIHNDLLNQLQLLVKISAPPLVEVAETPLEEPQWTPGQRLTALVLSNLPNGRFQVQVGDHVLDMNLPRNTQQGENVALTYVSNQPRLTFVLTRDLAAAAANATPADAKPQVTVSDSARFLGGLLQKIADHADGPASPLTRTAPLLSSAPADIKEFTATLRSALSQSGLFYESHQAQWVAGERKLTDLLQEPQGRFSTVNAVQGAEAGTGSKVAPSTPRSDSGLINTAQTATPETGSRSTPTLSQPDAALISGTSKFPVHAETISLVQQQLQTLDSHQLVWQGQVWPGQAMEWRVEERDAREGGGGDEVMPHWQTSLRLQLPSLGNVHATLAFVPQGLRINLKAADEGTAGIMQGAQDKLLRSMEAAGLRVLGMAVERDETA